MERGGAMATGDTGPEATTTARGRPRLRLVTMVIMEERTGAMATGAVAMATVSITDKSDENCQSSIEFR